MGDAHGRVRGVDALAPRSRGAEDVDTQVGGVDLELTGVVGLRHDQDAGRGGVDAPLGLGDRDALDTVDAALVLQVRPHPVLRLHGPAGLDGQAHVLVTAQVGVGGVQDLHGPALPLGVAGVHAGQVGGEQRRLLTTLTGLDLDDDVAGVVRIPGHKDLAQVLPGSGLGGLQGRHLGGEVRILRGQLAGVGQVGAGRLPGPVGGHDPAQLGVAAPQPTHGTWIGGRGPGHLGLDVRVLGQERLCGGEVLTHGLGFLHWLGVVLTGTSGTRAICKRRRRRLWEPAAGVVRRGYLLRLPYRASKRATRPPVSRIFCLPV